MSGRIGAPDSPLGIYTERWTFEVRTSPPSSPIEGEGWIRGDIAPESNQLATFRFYHGDGVWDIPIYESGTSEASVYEAWTFRVNGSLGYIPLIEAGDAAFTELRFQHDGTTTAMHNAPGLAAFFDVAITGTNSPVDEGDTLSVDYLVENTGDLQDTQDIRLQDFSDAVVDTDADVQLGGGASSTGTLTWTTGDGDSGEQQVDVLSDDTVASTTVTVGSALPDSGVKLYQLGNGSDSIHEYTLSTAYDVSTATLEQSADVSSEDTVPAGMAWNGDGSKVFVCGNDTDSIYEYDATTAYDVSTISLVQSLDISSRGTRNQGVAFNADGSKMYVTVYDNENIDEYSLSTAYDMSTASHSQSLDVSGQDLSPNGVAWNGDGTKLYVAGQETNAVYEYSLSTAYDVSTASLNQSESPPNFDGPGAISWNDDGTKFYFVEGGAVYEHTASAAYDISSISQDQTLDISSEETSAQGMAWSR